MNEDQIFAIFEPNLEERIDQAKERARRIMTKDHKTLADTVLYLQIVLANHYGIPIFDPYFKEKTIDELIFEVEVVNLSKESSAATGSKLLKEDEEGAAGLFDDWAEADLKSGQETQWQQEAQQFMETGKFKGEE